MNDPFLRASPTYIAAQRTNQSNGQGWDLRPYDMQSRFWSFVGSVSAAVFNPASVIGLCLLAGCVWLLVSG